MNTNPERVPPTSGQMLPQDLAGELVFPPPPAPGGVAVASGGNVWVYVGDGNTLAEQARSPESVPSVAGPPGITLYVQERKLARNGDIVDFAGKEIPWMILLLLCRNWPSRISSRKILDDVWGQGLGCDEYLYPAVTTVRKLIEPLGLNVENVRRVGYCLAESAGQKTQLLRHG
jgi:hypothetical protein